MQNYIYVIGIILLTCFVLYAGLLTRKTEGFATHSEFLDRQNKNYNSVGVSLISGRNEGSLGTSTGALTGTVVDKDIIDNYKLTGDKSGLFALIKKCEAVKTPDCSVFDDASYGKDCAICLDIGTAENPALNSEQKPTVGGRVLFEDERAHYNKTGQIPGRPDRIPNYVATVGTCPANRLVTTKQQCLSLQKELLCQKNANYDLPGCSQCYSDSTYTIVDKQIKGLVSGTGTIRVVGKGTLIFAVDRNDIRVFELSNTPSLIKLPGPEMSNFYFYVLSKGKDPIKLGGYLSGVTATGNFNIDLYRLIGLDLVTERKPAISGRATIDGIDISYMSPIAVSSEEDIFNIMVLVARSPFSFVDSLTQEASMCKDAPFVTTQAGAEFLESDPCYRKGSGPGKFSMECLQNVFLSNGCIQGGVGYPSTAVKAGTLMTAPDGKSRTLNDIATYVYEQAMLTATGLINGSEAPINKWSEASMFCTGKPVTSPCDTSTKNTGPLTKECLTYMWNNEGASKPLGATYNFWSNATSMFKKSNESQYCTTAGSMSPTLANGMPNTAAINYWRKQGGVNNVKSMMNTIHQMANYQSTIDDPTRSEYITKCYGQIPLSQPVADSAKGGCQYPTGSDIGLLCGEPQTSTPSNKVLWLDASDRSSLVLSGSTVVTWRDKSGKGYHATGVNGPTLVSGRIILNGSNQYFTTNYPATSRVESTFIVYSSNNRLQSSLVESSRPGGRQFQNDGHQGIGFGPGLASMGIVWIAMGTMSPKLSTTSLGELLYDSGGVNIYLNGKLSKNAAYREFTDGLTVIGGSPGQSGYYLNGTISEVIIYNRVLSSTERQTVEGALAWKWGFQRQLPTNHPFYNSPPSGLSTSTSRSASGNPVYVLGPFGIGPWYTTWAGIGQIPTQGNPQWIWNSPNADKQNMPNGYVTFNYVYKNTSGLAQATLWVAADNLATVFMNGTAVGGEISNFGAPIITFLNGDNLIKIVARNDGGPCGLLVNCVSEGVSLFTTNADWRYT